MEAQKENRVRKKIKGKKFVKDKDGNTGNVPSPSVDIPECLSAENVQRQSVEVIEIPAETLSVTATSMSLPHSHSQDHSEEVASSGLKPDKASAPSTVPSGASEQECTPFDVRNDGDEEKADQTEASSYGSPPDGTETSSTSSKPVEIESSMLKGCEVSTEGCSISFPREPPESENIDVHDQEQLIPEGSENMNAEGPEAAKCSEIDAREASRSASGSEIVNLSTKYSDYKDSEHIIENCEQSQTLLIPPSDIQIVPTSVRGKSPVASSNPSAPCLLKTADECPTQKVQGSSHCAVEPASALPSVGQWTTLNINTDALKCALTASETKIPEVRPFITQFTSCFPTQGECAQAKSPLEKVPLKISWAELEQQIELTLDESEDEAWTTIEYYRMILREDLLPERRKKADGNAESMSLRRKSNENSVLSIKVSDSMKNLYSGTSLLHRSEHTQNECKCKPLSCQSPHPIYTYAASCQQSIPSDHNHQSDGQDFYPCATSYGVCHHRCPKYKKKCHLQLQPYNAHPRHQQAGGNKQQETWLNKTKSILCRAKNAFRTSFQFKSVKKNQSEAGKDTNVTHGSPCDVNSSVDMQENRPAISQEVAQVMTAMSMSMTTDSPSAQLMFS